MPLDPEWTDPIGQTEPDFATMTESHDINPQGVEIIKMSFIFLNKIFFVPINQTPISMLKETNHLPIIINLVGD